MADTVARKLRAHPEYGVKLVGFVDVPRRPDGDEAGRRTVLGNLLGELDRFEDVCGEFNVERVVIAFSSMSHERLIDVIRGEQAARPQDHASCRGCSR